ncbi:MFS transporter [Aquabacterium sp. OR-4]|uniref:MFS transporter n=1 Tax=Aquabacterium sp. OR-4 TaxID=2978127 RepID=UPI0021B32E01|nr:MFS transporter [Aquabacterium sp. OR-4]MDT7835398.1 MFS transporter [Aquabacterium sp. OR-4]
MPEPTPAATSATLRRFGLLWFTYFAGIGLFNTYAPLWFKALGLSTLAIGAMSAMQAWTRLLAPYGWSWMADHSGQRTGLIRWAAAGALAATLGLWGLTGASGLWPVLLPGTAAVTLAVALLFVANGGVVPLAEAALSQLLVTRQGLDTARYGRVRVWGSIGFIVSVSLAGVALQATGTGLFPLAVALLNAALLLAALQLPAGAPAQRHAAPVPPVLPLLRRPTVAWFFASIFFTVLAHVSLYAFLSLYLDSLGYRKDAVGALWAVAVVCEVAFFFTQGRWSSLLTPHGWFKAAAAVSVLRFGAVALGGSSALVLVLAKVSHAVTFAGHHGGCIALLSRYFPDRLRGRGQALYTALGYGLSGLVGGLAGGWLIEYAGYAAVFWAAAASAALGLLCAVLAERADARESAAGRAGAPG